jgi:hypothetical protein
MITWIKENTGLFSLLSSVVLIISSGAVAKYKLDELVEQQAEVQQHIHDTTRHLDPVRDTAARKRDQERIRKLEARLEKLEEVQGAARQLHRRAQ